MEAYSEMARTALKLEPAYEAPSYPRALSYVTSYYMDTPHISVLRDETVSYLNPKDGGVYVDATFGAGGHSRALLESADCRVIALDRDPHVMRHVDILKDTYGKRFEFIQGCFGQLDELLQQHHVRKVDGILMDIGVSSMQIDTPRRGFSFQHDGPLDMRMDDTGQLASDIVNTMPEEELAGLIFRLGDEKQSRKIAHAICVARQKSPITRTSQLAGIIRDAVGHYNDTIDPATRTFQALRIWVNDELGQLEQALEASERVLAPGGRLAVITFHSGEDTIVKHFLKERSGKSGASVSRHQPLPMEQELPPTFKKITKKAVAPDEEEVRHNKRARSAKLRVAERTRTPARRVM